MKDNQHNRGVARSVPPRLLGLLLVGSALLACFGVLTASQGNWGGWILFLPSIYNIYYLTVWPEKGFVIVNEAYERILFIASVLLIVGSGFLILLNM
ncbi:MAG: hypothetical protein L3J24_06205 [Xanthomonadales bacterium]|nr:hypothetical protein [Xanthomonadales bacterium]